MTSTVCIIVMSGPCLVHLSLLLTFFRIVQIQTKSMGNFSKQRHIVFFKSCLASPDNFRFLHTCIKELTFQYKFYESKKLVLFTRCIRLFSAIQCIQLRHTYIVIQYTAVSTHNTVKLLFCVHSIGRPPLFNVLSFYNISPS